MMRMILSNLFAKISVIHGQYIEVKMCRLLLVKSKKSFQIGDYLYSFSQVAQNSIEFQGHGWGCAYLENGDWKIYKNIKPIWEDNNTHFRNTNILLAHARSAYQDKGIEIENNMPFKNGQNVFIFNGELRGVKIKEKGRIGAEKIFNYILRFNKGDLFAAYDKALRIIEKRTEYIRAMDIIMADFENLYISTLFNEQEEYFTLHYKNDENRLIICSEPFPNQTNWDKIPNRIRKVIKNVDH